MIKELLEQIKHNGEDRLNLYFITRELKKGIKSRSKVLEKYKFTVHAVDIDNEIKSHLFELSIDQLEYIIKKDLDIAEYEVVSDDTKQIFTYSMTNKVMSFADVVNEQLKNKSQIQKVKDLSSLTKNAELWAYCVGFFDNDNNWIYSFRKILRGKTVVENNKKKVSFFRTKFDTISSKLEMVHGETINLDEKIDCLYVNDTFYIIQKTQFENITCISEEFKEKAEQVANELIETGLIKGGEILKKMVEEKPSLHKKLAKLQKIDNYKNLKKTDINKMLRVAKKYGGKLKKDKEGNLLLETPNDVDLTIKVLADFYKIGEFSKKSYGTFSGKKLQESK